MFAIFFFFKQKTAYEMRISDWSSDVCSSDLADGESRGGRHTDRSIGCGGDRAEAVRRAGGAGAPVAGSAVAPPRRRGAAREAARKTLLRHRGSQAAPPRPRLPPPRYEERRVGEECDGTW